MKTAIQELIEWFHNRPEYDKTSEGYEIMEKAKELLEKEKEQIRMAVDHTQNKLILNDIVVDSIGSGDLTLGEMYYNYTYNK